MGDLAVKTTSAECTTLREYRMEVLRMPQSKVAEKARCSQAWISYLERTGHTPQPWNRDMLLRAYQIEEDELVRLLKNTPAANALKRPAAEDNTPLLAQEVIHSDKATFEQLRDVIRSMQDFARKQA